MRMDEHAWLSNRPWKSLLSPCQSSDPYRDVTKEVFTTSYGEDALRPISCPVLSRDAGQSS